MKVSGEGVFLIDAGNTSITIGIGSGDEIQTHRIATERGKRSVQEYKEIFNRFLQKHWCGDVKGSVISSVVPQETDPIAHALRSISGREPLVVNYRVKTGLTFETVNPSGLGADRIANAVAAHHLYEGDCIVIDFGTATTCCLVTGDGRFMGGTIMPGAGLSVKALSENTSLLPVVDLSHPGRVLGGDTYASIASGVILGQAGAVERIINEMRQESGGNPLIIATGGYADLVAPYIKVDHIDPLLTLRGLIVIFSLNS